MRSARIAGAAAGRTAAGQAAAADAAAGHAAQSPPPGARGRRGEHGGGVLAPFAAIVAAMLPAVLDQTILSTALPTIATDLGRVTDVSVVVSAYVVAAGCATPVWGKLGDRHGRKAVLQPALALFLAASAVCGVAQDITMLVLARVIQGVAAGGLMTLAMAAVGDLVTPRERGRFQGYIAATFAVATVAGPFLGGLLTGGPGWRWVFYVNLPLGIVALAALARTLPAGEAEPARAPLDALGAVLLAAATAAFMLACAWGGEHAPWTSATIVGLLGAATILAVALVARERRASDPIVPFGLLRTRTVAVASAALFLATAALFAITVFVPLFLQVATGATPTQAGLLLVPMMLGITISTNVAGRLIARTGRYALFPVAGLALMTAALTLLAIVVRQESRVTVGIGLAVFGLGFGMVGQVLIVAVQNAVDRRRLGIAMATTSFFRALGGATGAAVLGAVFASRVGTHPASGLRGVAVTEVVHGVTAVFAVAAPLAAVALAVALALPELPFGDRSPGSGSGTPGKGVDADRRRG